MVPRPSVSYRPGLTSFRLPGQLFSYAILGFAFVEAIGLFDLMVALMAKFVRCHSFPGRVAVVGYRKKEGEAIELTLVQT